MLTTLDKSPAATAGPDAAAIMRITICICTFRRPEGLAAVLAAVRDLNFQIVKRPELSVVVVDNDGSADARAAVDAFATGDISATYVVESRRGISQARNACLDNVPADADFVAFLDDDVVPRPEWLEELIFAIVATGAEAATGPCRAVYYPDTPLWIRLGRFFATPRAKNPVNHAPIQFGVMGNIIIRGSFLRDNTFRFDEKLSLVSGEDRKFFTDMFAEGANFVWAEQAIIDHHVSPDRLTFNYILSREFGVGCAAAILERVQTHGDRRFALYALRVVGRLALKIVLWAPMSLVATMRDNAYLKYKPTLDVVNLSGRIYGMFGHKHEFYK